MTWVGTKDGNWDENWVELENGTHETWEKLGPSVIGDRMILMPGEVWNGNWDENWDENWDGNWDGNWDARELGWELG